MRNVAPLLITAIVSGMGAMAATVIAQNQPAQPQQPAPPRAKPLKVGVVDIGVLFREYRRKDTLETQVNVEREQVRKDVDKAAERIRALREALDKSAFREGSEQWMRQRDEIRIATHQAEYEQERRTSMLKKRVEELTLTILSEIEFTIDAYGGRNGFDLVLKSDKGAADANDDSQLGAQFQERIFRAQISDVLFHSEGVEITEAIKRELNSDAAIEAADKRARAAQAAANAPRAPQVPVPPAPQGNAPPAPNNGGKSN